MSFAKPEWLLLLIALPILAFATWIAWRRRGERWKKLVAPRLQSRLSSTRSPWIHFSFITLALLGLGGLIIALAQPESGEEWIEVESEGRNILFCVDISRSMLAADTAPNRLQTSRAAALEILERFPNDRVGVLLFSGETLIQAPLTLDHSFVEQTLAQLDPADIPYGGSNLTSAIKDGSKLLNQSGQTSNIMVVFSDGEESTSGLEAAAAAAAKSGIFIYALGMGTTEGSFIPDPRERDGKFRDRSGNPVFTQLNEGALQTLAAKTEGFYSRGIGSDFLRKLDSALAEMDRFREDGKHQRVAKTAHQWFLFIGLLLLMISVFVRVLPLRPAVAAFACFLAIPQSKADLIKDGREALEQGDPIEAHQFFQQAAKDQAGERAARLNLAAGSAAYQAKNWDAAADSFSDALKTDNSSLQQSAHYGLATSLFYLGIPLEDEKQREAWLGAVEHYKSALAIDATDQQSRENLATIQALLKKQEEEEKKEENEKDQKGQDKESDPSEEPEKKSDENSKEGQNQDQEKQPDQEPKEDPQQNGKGQGEEQEEQPPGEKSDPNSEGEPKEGKPSGEKPQPGEGENPQPQPQPNPPQQGDPAPEDSAKQKSQATPMEEGPAPQNETRAERARRLLKQYADFGAKAPRRMRKPYSRSAQDW